MHTIPQFTTAGCFEALYSDQVEFVKEEGRGENYSIELPLLLVNGDVLGQFE